ncbi:MAG TPA: TadE/TadG family type IV pilus assembly protein, partial [Verrucomicrobiae bacterium]
MDRNLKKFFWRCAGTLFRLHSARDGATAVEFALIAPAFIAVLVAILEVAYFLFAQQTLQMAATTAGRLIMTGQVQNSAMTQSQFAAAVCPMVNALINC